MAKFVHRPRVSSRIKPTGETLFEGGRIRICVRCGDKFAAKYNEPICRFCKRQTIILPVPNSTDDEDDDD